MNTELLNQLFGKKIIPGYHSVHKQSYMLKLALQEAKLVPYIKTTPIALKHQKGISFYNGNCYPIIFPRNFIERVKQFSQEKIYDYCFIGKIGPHRNWIYQYANKNSYIETQLQREKTNKDYFDPNFYKTICNSYFGLCPIGDPIEPYISSTIIKDNHILWTYRFFETIMCKAIPIIDYPFDQANKFVYFLHNEQPIYNKEIIEYNYETFLKYHSFTYEIITRKQERLATCNYKKAEGEGFEPPVEFPPL